VGRYIWRPLIEVVSIFFSVLSQNFPKTVHPANALFREKMALMGAVEREKITPRIARGWGFSR
jgi:hypothetical protein